MAVGPWAQPLDCPIGSVAPQLLCTPGAQRAACQTQLCGVRKGKARLFSYLCSSPAVLMHHLLAALPAPSPQSQDPSCTGQGKKRADPLRAVVSQGSRCAQTLERWQRISAGANRAPELPQCRCLLGAEQHRRGQALPSPQPGFSQRLLVRGQQPWLCSPRQLQCTLCPRSARVWGGKARCRGSRRVSAGSRGPSLGFEAAAAATPPAAGQEWTQG